MLRHGVDRQEGDNKRAAVDILLELGVVAVGLHLAELKAASTTKHDIDDIHIAERGYNPLPYVTACTKANNEASRPHKHLAKIVGTAYKAVEAGIHKA